MNQHKKTDTKKGKQRATPFAITKFSEIWYFCGKKYNITVAILEKNNIWEWIKIFCFLGHQYYFRELYYSNVQLQKIFYNRPTNSTSFWAIQWISVNLPSLQWNQIITPFLNSRQIAIKGIGILANLEIILTLNVLLVYNLLCNYIILCYGISFP